MRGSTTSSGRWISCGWELVIAGVLVTTAVACLLLSPGPARETESVLCVKVIDIWGPVRLTINCDSREFLLLAEKPWRVLTLEHRERQSRPLYGAIGWTLALPFRALGLESLGLRVLGRQVILGSGQPYGRYLPEYAGLLFLNWLVLVASVVLFRRLLAARSFLETCMILPLAVLLVNEVTKAFFWTPHLQVFNILLPVASVYLFHWMQPRLPLLSLPRIVVIGLLLGLANLLYGAFAVTAVGAALCVLLGEGFPALRKQFATKILSGVLLLASFIAPLAAWSAFLVARTGSFYSSEIVEYRQFVWVLDSWSRNAYDFSADLSHNLAAYMGTLIAVTAFPVLALTALAIVAYAMGVAWQPADRDREMGRAIQWYLLANVPFYALMGFYRTRLSWTIVPALMLILGAQIARLELAISGRARLAVKAGVVGLAISHVAYWIAKAGPYS
jgi:hypothetical protein